MSSIFGSTQSHLARRIDVASACKKHGLEGEVLVVGDHAPAAERLVATLRVLFGYQAAIRRTRSQNDEINTLASRPPQLLFLADQSSQYADLAAAISVLRVAGYIGPVIVVTKNATRAQRVRLIAGGVVDVIHSDDVDSSRVGEAIEAARKFSPADR